jgi:dTDP-glucose pyrophosphorylase
MRFGAIRDTNSNLKRTIQMIERPNLNKGLDKKIFRSFYYLKTELVDFCRENNLPTSGGKIEITDRVAYFLETGNAIPASKTIKSTTNVGAICEDTEIEADFVCTEKHRAFFKNEIGKSFKFNVVFQKWLKSNAGKTYRDAITAYHQILEEKKKGKTLIDKQFEYNTYVRDFFADNEGRSLESAILCWKYKKSMSGHNHYEKSDLIALS